MLKAFDTNLSLDSCTIYKQLQITAEMSQLRNLAFFCTVSMSLRPAKLVSDSRNVMAPVKLFKRAN